MVDKVGRKERPSGAILADAPQPGRDEIEGLPSKIERYSKARKRAIEVSRFLRLAGEKKYSARVAGCGNYLLFRHYYTVGRVRLTKASFCKKTLLCPLCAIRKASKMLRVYVERFKYLKEQHPGLRASLVTFTVKNGDDLAERFQHLTSCVQALRMKIKDSKRGKGRNRYQNSEWCKVLGLVGSYEVTNKGNGWHPHTHMIVLSKESLKESEIQKEWKRISGDSYIINVSEIPEKEDPTKDFIEVFKYALKFSDLSLEDTYQAFKTLTKHRLTFAQGLFYGVKVPEALTDQPLDDLPYIELLFRYFQGSGYNLSYSSRISELSPVGQVETLSTA